MNPDIRAQIEHNFTYQPPFGDQIQRYQQLRAKAKEFALLIVDLTPYSQEQSEALSLLNLACMSANAAIARNEIDSHTCYPDVLMQG